MDFIGGIDFARRAALEMAGKSLKFGHKKSE